jgi:signal transduction histidine kinase
MAVFRIFQEMLSTWAATRGARVDVRSSRARQLHLTVRDDGVGAAPRR